MNTYTVNLSATSINVANVLSPAQITFNPNTITSLNGFNIAKLVYDFGDNTDPYTVFSSNSGSATTVSTTHNFFRSTSADSPTVTASVSAYEYTTFACKIYNVVLNLTIPAFASSALLYPVNIQAMNDKVFIVQQQTDADSSAPYEHYIHTSIIIPASATDYVSSDNSSTCINPTPSSNFTVTLTASSTPIYGATFAASAISGVMVFVSDQGNSSNSNYASIAAAVNSITADAYLFGGNNNYPHGSIATIAGNWSGYSSLLSQETCYPALGFRDLQATSCNETVVSILLLEEESWKYSLSATSGNWYVDSHDDTLWASGNTPIGFATGNFINTVVATAHPLTAWCTETLPVTSIYGRNTFTAILSDFTSANALRVRYRHNDAIAIFINEQLVITDNMYTPYSSAVDVICEHSKSDAGPWIYKYIPLDYISVGVNTLAVHVAQHPNDQASLFFDVEISTTRVPNTPIPSTYGAPQTQYFDLPGNNRYYDVILPGDVHLFVLNSGVSDIYPCRWQVEPDGIAVGSTQYLWFTNAILNSTSRWKVVMFHTPFFGSTPYPLSYLLPEFNWGFESLGVDLILNGALGINEHCIREKVHYVNCSCTTNRITPITTNSEYSMWNDIAPYNDNKGLPAIVKIVATQSDINVMFLRASTLTNIHSFKIV